MIKHKKLTKADKALDAVFGLVMAIVFGLIALGVLLMTTIFNVGSVSTIADFDLRQYWNNILSLHSDGSFQTTTNLNVYDKRKFTLVRDKQNSFSIPQGAVFKFRGDVNRDEHDWIAVEVFDGVDKRTGFIIVERGSLGSPASATRDVSHYEDGIRPMRSPFVTYLTSAEEDGIRNSIWQSKLLPQLKRELRSNLSITMANTSLTAEAMKENPDLIHIAELNEGQNSYFAPKKQKDIYKRILGFHEDGLDMALYQIDPNFDALQQISEGTVPKAGPSPLWIWLIFGGASLWLLSKLMRPRKIKCSSCGVRSREHELLEQQEFKAYKHQTKKGRPDARYKNNSLLTHRTSKFCCVSCGAEFTRTT